MYGLLQQPVENRRLSCDANLTRVVFDPESQPLDVGRTKRLITPALRAAVCARDLGCVFPRCDRPSHWCDAHHLHHWADGGDTSIENLILLCRHHHVLIHEGGWTITGTPRQPRLLPARRQPTRRRPATPPLQEPIYQHQTTRQTHDRLPQHLPHPPPTQRSLTPPVGSSRTHTPTAVGCSVAVTTSAQSSATWSASTWSWSRLAKSLAIRSGS